MYNIIFSAGAADRPSDATHNVYKNALDNMIVEPLLKKRVRKLLATLARPQRVADLKDPVGGW